MSALSRNVRADRCSRINTSCTRPPEPLSASGAETCDSSAEVIWGPLASWLKSSGGRLRPGRMLGRRSETPLGDAVRRCRSGRRYVATSEPPLPNVGPLADKDRRSASAPSHRLAPHPLPAYAHALRGITAPERGGRTPRMRCMSGPRPEYIAEWGMPRAPGGGMHRLLGTFAMWGISTKRPLCAKLAHPGPRKYAEVRRRFAVSQLTFQFEATLRSKATKPRWPRNPAFAAGDAELRRRHRRATCPRLVRTEQDHEPVAARVSLADGTLHRMAARGARSLQAIVPRSTPQSKARLASASRSKGRRVGRTSRPAAQPNRRHGAH